MVALDVFRIIVIGVFLISLEFSPFNLTHLFLVTFFMGIGNSLFWPTSQAFTQEIVSEKEYFDANKLLSVAFKLARYWSGNRRHNCSYIRSLCRTMD